MAVYIRAYCKSTRREEPGPRVNNAHLTGENERERERENKSVRARKDEIRGEGVLLVTPSHFHGEMWNTNYSEKSLFPASVFAITRRTRSPYEFAE